MENINISINDLLLFTGVYMIQQKNPIIELFGYVLLFIISYIEIKKYKEKKQRYYYLSIIFSATKKDYTIYNNIMESIYNKEYEKIDIMKTYNNIVYNLNNLDYDYDKINNSLDILCFLATIDNIMFLNKKWAKFLMEDTEILDIYARLVNRLHNISIITDYDIDKILFCKELDELYSNYNYTSIKKKITSFCNKYDNNINNIYQM